MNYNQFGKTDMKISEISLGTWAVGGDWGNTSRAEAVKGLEFAIDQGVNFFDTADSYGQGLSEEIIGQVLKQNPNKVYVATKFGRQDDFTNPENYTYDAVRAYCESSLKRLQVESLDLYQIHCPTNAILEDLQVFEVLDQLKKEGKIRYYGVSVETDAQANFVMDHTNASSLQMIFNILRQKPLTESIAKAQENGVGIIARVPLASGLLSGKYNKDSVFPSNDHRNFNKDGESFNVGETFGGLPFDKAIELVNQLSWIADDRQSMAQAALRWIIQQEGVSTVIQGFKSIKQIESNIGAANVPAYTPAELETLSDFYWQEVHEFIRGDY